MAWEWRYERTIGRVSVWRYRGRAMGAERDGNGGRRSRAAEPGADRRGEIQLPLRLHGALLQRHTGRRRSPQLPAEQCAATLGRLQGRRRCAETTARCGRTGAEASRRSGGSARSSRGAGTCACNRSSSHGGAETAAAHPGSKAAAAAEAGSTNRHGGPGRSTRARVRLCADAAAAAACSACGRPRLRRGPSGGVQHGAARRRTHHRLPGAQRAVAVAILPANDRLGPLDGAIIPVQAAAAAPPLM
jgi:hypothetical protein